MTPNTHSRRFFLGAGGLALLGSHRSLAALALRTGAVQAPFQLKSQAQYQREAADFDAAIRDLGLAATMNLASHAASDRFTDIVTSAGNRLDNHFSWLVARCLDDATVMGWARQEFKTEAALEEFVAGAARNPGVVHDVPGVPALLARLSALSAEKRNLADRIVNKTRQAAGLEAAAGASARQAAEQAECTKIISVIAAVVLVVVAVIVTAVTFGATVTRGNRAEAAQAEIAGLAVANERYQQCLRAAAALPHAERRRALAECQSSWLEAKAGYLV